MFILLTIRKDDVRIDDLRHIILQKAEERKSTVFIENKTKYLNDIKNSEDLLKFSIHIDLSILMRRALNF